MTIRFYRLAFIFLFAFSGLSAAAQKPEVVVYTSVDQVYAEPVLRGFEAQTGIAVKAVYDVEASKTVGLEKRLLAERQNPRADVFWNSEYLRTLRLAQQQALAPYVSPQAGRIPAETKDSLGYWTGFGARQRVFVVKTQLLQPEDYPQRLADLAAPRWKGRGAVAKPVSGTSSTHFAALYARWGAAKFSDFLNALLANQVAFLPGNAAVRDAVAAGDYAFGLTDTDDVQAALGRGDKVAMVFPDQDGDGAFSIPFTVALVAGGPNPEQGKKLMDYLLGLEVEQALIQAGALHGPALKSWRYLQPDLPEALQSSARLIQEALSR